jgi:hypothetical protein
MPLLREMEKTVLLIPQVFSSPGFMSDLGLSPSDDKRPSTFLARHLCRQYLEEQHIAYASYRVGGE